ncbi:type I restriction enzyme, S subunit [Fodinibius roseus]|uniref:Type I restriction enzyme, S subunit n=1 Tax=Fodinibius roseus TaxID=1194090 RepID=A0A1M5HM56_9BACT|nr:restriction endonuclease subunit S [Fodinibius roseus]SHG16991.1 type I restriction enzyme, S subunit [Fodinibius roseus]
MWETENLGEIVSFKGGGTPSKQNPSFWNGNIPWASVKDIKGDYLEKTESKITQEGVKNSSTKVCSAGDLILITRISPGKSIISKIDCAINQDLKIVDVNGDIDKMFLHYYFKSQINEVEKKSSGTTVLGISLNELKQLTVPVPPLPTQHRIVEKIEELFSDLDNGIKNLKKAKQQLETYKQSVLKAAFEGKLTKGWREQQNDLPTPEELKQQIEEERKKYREQQLKEWQQEVEEWKEQGEPGQKPRKPRKPKDLDPLEDDELEELPNIQDDWFYHQLYYLGELGRGRSRHRPRSDEKLFKDGQYPFIQTGQVRNANKYVTEYNKCYNDFGLEQSKLWPSGTLCITIAANIAETAFLKFDACFPDSVVGFTGHNNIINKEFIYYYFHAIQKRLEAYAPATAQKNINLTILENLTIPYCSPKEQFQIVNELESRLSVVDQNLNTIEQELQKSKALRQSILKRAFEGKLIN